MLATIDNSCSKTLEELEPIARQLFLATFFPNKDFTVVYSDQRIQQYGVDNHCDEQWWPRYCQLKAGGDSQTSFEFAERLTEGGSAADARLQVSRAFADKAWTVSVRWEPKDALRARVKPNAAIRRDLKKSRWAPMPGYNFSGTDGPFLFSIREIVDSLWDLISSGGAPLDPGFIFVAGATNSSKSLVARGLIWKHLSAKLDVSQGAGRCPHLVTFEDPIEEFFLPESEWFLLPRLAADGPPTTPGSSLSLPAIDYTPRQRPLDCGSLREGLTGALRQTPSAYYIGELRDPKEIAKAVDFAGSGHLAVATGHAGNLIESAEKIMRAVHAVDPGTRALYVPKILAIIHLKRLKQTVELPGSSGASIKHTLEGLVPTLYRRTQLGMHGLIGDGLFSLAPYFADQDAEQNAAGCLGRQYLVRKLSSQPMDPEAKPERALGRDLLFQKWRALREWNLSRGSDATPPAMSGTRLIDVALWEDLNGR